MGGVIDPERGALIYKKTTQVETVDPDPGSSFAQKKIKKVTSESSWLGKPEMDQKALLDEEEEWQDEAVEKNPLYSPHEYNSDFNNPLYNRRISSSDKTTTAVQQQQLELQPRGTTAGVATATKDGGRAARGRPTTQRAEGEDYVDYLSEEPTLGNADTLF